MGIINDCSLRNSVPFVNADTSPHRVLSPKHPGPVQIRPDTQRQPGKDNDDRHHDGKLRLEAVAAVGEVHGPRGRPLAVGAPRGREEAPAAVVALRAMLGEAGVGAEEAFEGEARRGGRRRD